MEKYSKYLLGFYFHPGSNPVHETHLNIANFLLRYGLYITKPKISPAGYENKNCFSSSCSKEDKFQRFKYSNLVFTAL